MPKAHGPFTLTHLYMECSWYIAFGVGVELVGHHAAERGWPFHGRELCALVLACLGFTLPMCRQLYMGHWQCTHMLYCPSGGHYRLMPLVGQTIRITRITRYRVRPDFRRGSASHIYTFFFSPILLYTSAELPRFIFTNILIHTRNKKDAKLYGNLFWIIYK